MSTLTDITNEYMRLGILYQIDYDKLYLYSITITEIIGITGFSRPTVTRAINTLKEYLICRF